MTPYEQLEVDHGKDVAIAIKIGVIFESFFLFRSPKPDPEAEVVVNTAYSMMMTDLLERLGILDRAEEVNAGILETLRKFAVEHEIPVEEAHVSE